MVLHNICNMDSRDLPNMYALTLRPQRAHAYTSGKSQLSMLHMLCNTMATALLTQSHKELSHLSVGLVIQASTSI